RTSSAERPPPPVPERSVSVPPRASPEWAGRPTSGERPGPALERAVVDRLPERRPSRPGPAAAELSMERTSLSGSGALKTGESLSVLTPSGFERKPGPPVDSGEHEVGPSPRESGPERRVTAARPLVPAPPMETKPLRSPGRHDSAPSVRSGATDPGAGRDDPDDVLPTSDYRRQSEGGPAASGEGSGTGEASADPSASGDDGERSEPSDGGTGASQGGSTGLVQWAVARPWAVAVASFVGFGLLILMIYAGYLLVRSPPADDRPKGSDPRAVPVKPTKPVAKAPETKPAVAPVTPTTPEKSPDTAKPVEPDAMAQVSFVAPKGTRISLPDGRQVGPGTYEFRPGVLNIQFICPPKAPPKKGAKPVETIINRAVEAQVHPGLPPLQVRLCSK
ncbi:MAG: hypothetical protein K1X89_25245, partial [Myxococcaceae bacterium]|nr:hypothetical protein [Myxococcaceae bacterium]